MFFFCISTGKRKRLIRQREPSQLSSENSERFSVPVSEISARRRRKDTLDSCQEIHGGAADLRPALDGMWVTFVNKCKPKQLYDYFANSKKAKNVLGPVVKKSIESFESSEQNHIRSVKVLYSKGLLSKEKYKNIRSNLSMSCITTSKRRKAIEIMKGARIPKLLTYDKVKQFIDSRWNADKVCNPSELYEDLDDCEHEHVSGAYRELHGLLLELADLFIFLDQTLGEKSHILCFSEVKYHFRVACGADGAPFGKDDEATAWLVSFLNSGTHIGSEKENYLLAGANCSESHVVMQRFAKRLIHSFQSIERETFFVRGFSVKFSLELLPSDMKFLASYCGELSNAAHYFSSFGDVNENNKHITNGSLGPMPEDTWHPWVYAERLEVAAQVKQLKENLSKTSLAESTKRKKVLDFIRSKNSRQEFEPLFGPYVKVGFSEPLHNSNNAWQFIHSIILVMSIEKSNIPTSCKDCIDVPEGCSFAKYLTALKTEVKAGRLLKKVKKWFNSGRKGNFEYRFTGKESKKFSHKFMYLVAALESEDDTPDTQMRLYAVAYCTLELRGAASLFSRAIVTKKDVTELQEHCQRFFNVVSTLLQRVNPTVWTVGYAIPYHTKLLFDKYQLGLGINSMQGREAKHVRLQQYARHASLTTRWETVLKHDFVSNIWLRKADPHQCTDQYIPGCIHNDSFCFCAFPKQPNVEKCRFCSSDIYQEVVRTAVLRDLSDGLRSLLSVVAE